MELFRKPKLNLFTQLKIRGGLHEAKTAHKRKDELLSNYGGNLFQGAGSVEKLTAMTRNVTMDSLNAVTVM